MLQSPVIMIFMFDRGNFESYRQQLSLVDWDSLLVSDDIDISTSNITRTLIDAVTNTRSNRDELHSVTYVGSVISWWKLNCASKLSVFVVLFPNWFMLKSPVIIYRELVETKYFHWQPQVTRLQASLSERQGRPFRRGCCCLCQGPGNLRLSVEIFGFNQLSVNDNISWQEYSATIKSSLGTILWILRCKLSLSRTKLIVLQD
jgi:hypothetical protein